VIRPVDAGLSGAADDLHFARAIKEGWTLLTKNPRDFLELHEKNNQHYGILATLRGRSHPTYILYCPARAEFIHFFLLPSQPRA
jgi:hypothetical protein